MDVSVGAVAATNPYLLNGDDLGAAGANLTVDPSVFFEDGNTSASLAGNLSLDKFFGKYDLKDSIAIKGTGERRINERTTVSADVDFRSSNSPADRFYSGANLGNLAAGEIPDNSQLDPTLANLTGRTSRLEVNASVQRLLSPKSSLTSSAGVGITRVSSTSGVDYQDAHVELDYADKLAEITSLLFTIEGGYADYSHQQAGDGLFVTPLVGLERQFTRFLHFSAQVGASVAAIESAAGDRQTTVTWAGKLDLCNRNAKVTACVTGVRSTRPTSLGGLTTVSSIEISYARAIGSRGNLSAAATYARTSQSSVALFNALSGRSELVNASGTFHRKVGKRVSAFITPSFTSIKDEQYSRRDNYQVLLGISYSFGTRQ